MIQRVEFTQSKRLNKELARVSFREHALTCKFKQKYSFVFSSVKF